MMNEFTERQRLYSDEDYDFKKRILMLEEMIQRWRNAHSHHDCAACDEVKQCIDYYEKEHEGFLTDE